MRRWIRKVWPSGYCLVTIAVLYVLLLLLPQLIYQAAGGIGSYEDAWTIGLPALVFFAILYGLYRVIWFHPVYQPEYLNWLRQTPWSVGKPLPGGPLHLVIQDVVFIGILTALSWLHEPGFVLLIPIVFIGARIAAWWFSFMYTQHWKHAYLLAFVLSAVVPMWNSPVAQLTVLSLLYAVVLHGIQNTLHSFDDWSGRKDLCRSGLLKSQSKSEKLLGWPYDRLAPSLSSETPSFGWSVATSILLAWWVFLLVAVIWPHEPFVLTVVCFFACGCAVLRASLYLSGCSDPFSFRLRLLTGQLIHPGFDIVLLASLLILALAGTVSLSVFLLGLPLSVAAAIISGGSMLIAFRCPPEINEWKLTGKHRIIPGLVMNASELQQTQ